MNEFFPIIFAMASVLLFLISVFIVLSKNSGFNE